MGRSKFEQELLIGICYFRDFHLLRCILNAMSDTEKVSTQAEKLVIDPKAPLQGQMDSLFKKQSLAALKKKVSELAKTSEEGERKG
jgi:hypothetical protein